MFKNNKPWLTATIFFYPTTWKTALYPLLFLYSATLLRPTPKHNNTQLPFSYPTPSTTILSYPSPILPQAQQYSGYPSSTLPQAQQYSATLLLPYPKHNNTQLPFSYPTPSTTILSYPSPTLPQAQQYSATLLLPYPKHNNTSLKVQPQKISIDFECSESCCVSFWGLWFSGWGTEEACCLHLRAS